MNKAVDVDVIVAGAGPVGLLAAIELTLGGARVLVLERLTAVNMAPKALSIGPLGSEALARRGMGPAVAAAEEQAMQGAGAPMRARTSKFSGHFGGLFLRTEAQSAPQRRMRLLNQQATETILGARARALGVEVRRGCAVTGFEQGPDGVEVAWTGPDGGTRLRCAWLVGCDGGRSAVRKLAGFAFPGTAPTMTMYQATVDIDQPQRLHPIGWNRTPGGMFSYGAFPGRLFMMDFSGPPSDRDAPVTLEEINAVLRRISGAAVNVTALGQANRWTDNTRLVDTYRLGRVLLAGDAAHIHSPFGGQGLSLGLTDAANLGWKLAAVVRGEMPATLLDTYTAERRPLAEAVLANTLAQVAIMRPDPQSGAMRDLFANLMALDDVNRSVGETIRGLGVRYDLGAAQAQVGTLAADQPAGVGVMLYDLMQDGAGVLLDASRGPDQQRWRSPRRRGSAAWRSTPARRC
jgi:2-polyprenyl-6-methoxyphenol hydroxylase-like FAD-dependent oxidoreductase